VRAVRAHHITRSLPGMLSLVTAINWGARKVKSKSSFDSMDGNFTGKRFKSTGLARIQKG
jgi:hypothetical protein